MEDSELKEPLQLEQRPWHMANLAKRNRFAWKNAYMTDCTLIVGEEKKEFQCHKYYLCLASSVLDEALLKDSEENQKIFLPHISSLNFHAVLEYIYTDYIKKKNLVTIQSAWIAARELGIISLEQYCVTCARQRLCVSNACSTLQFARLINDEEFEQFCTQYIQENTAKVLHATNWRKIEQRTLETILKLEIVHDICEVDLFKACVKWAEENTPADGNKRDTLGPLIGLIRFLAFKVEDFALTVCPTKILTPEEMVVIFCCLVTVARGMPAGFSIDSSPRNRAVGSDILEASTSINVNVNSCYSVVPISVQTEQVELREIQKSEIVSSRFVDSRKVTEALINQELIPPIPPTDNCLFKVGKTHAIKFPLGNKYMPNRNGEEILQSPLAFSVNSVACILGIEFIPWRSEKPIAYNENLQVSLSIDGEQRIVATFEGSLERTKSVMVNFDIPVCVIPNTIYKLNVIYSDPCIKHRSFLMSKNEFITSWGMKLSIVTTGKHYTNIKKICFGEVLQ